MDGVKKIHKIERLDHKIICDLIEPEARVLDLGCGDGDLLYHLAVERKAKVQGIELNEGAIYKCVEKGVSVFHGDIEVGLKGYPDKSFDYVLLNQSMQETKNVEFVIHEALRVGTKIIVGFPNFAYFKARFRIFFRGRVPITRSLPYHWYTTPNLHFLSIKDFQDYAHDKKLKVLKSFYLAHKKEMNFFPNMFALNAIFVLTNPT
ncbi:MAG: methionine biosynthesis protein MetW [Omnitrophica bacterium RIFCSPLOWO2_12_FULL_44_17]|uniref:Methionine biosynthesis protein MetW n=1 Tax=Candidatus Danuiimicrobium aquiferis TaxID=1801832 RepID=A0A1G1KTW9_9BACT|nr:MAG: methionine biosynthesis protein MetW [Omnitrophica bacterium RIFCSPHIGHO2_02_FULL_45_28]OGW96371.1 MAG: methionine biosynthesis protein MetW [Omnitrophica bacterium RIFCSPLOWO2_12_FULL_44_17]OGX04820.1 MAG: methionine biosynthesis protein MetW [Omnitrophica bacterium RIFCSPLOWO2_02_FULL_44_11]